MIHSNSIMFLILCSALVLFMTPGLAFFYGGLVRASSVVSMMMMSFGSLALIATLWIVFGYAITFANAGTGTFIGLDSFYGIDLDKLFLADVIEKAKSGDGFDLVFAGFQGTFAIITVALISGAIADRAKFGAWMIFAAVWATLVYFPVASWVFNFTVVDGKIVAGGWLVHELGMLDFAGGTVVEIASGASALALALVVGKRFGFTKGMHAPHNVPLTLIGAAILWFGWFGFNAGSALEANGSAVLAFVNTLLATAAAVLGWSFAEWITKGKPSMLGAASGCVAGLVAVTPAAGFVGPMGALAIGAAAGVVCLWGVSGLKKMLGSDDSLDVFGVHGVGGILGALLTGVFADPALGGTGIWDYVANAVAPDYSIASQLWIQAQGVIVTLIWSGIVSFIAFKLVDIVIGLRVKEDQEREGLDITSHGESAYES